MGVCHTGERHLSLLLRQEKNANVVNKIAWSAQHLFSLISVMEPQISDIGGDVNQGGPHTPASDPG